MGVSWDGTDGVTLFVNGQLVDQRTFGSINQDAYDVNGTFYVGRSTSDMSQRHYANAVFDDMQLWEAKREYLVSFNLIQPGLSVPQFITLNASSSKRDAAVWRPSVCLSSLFSNVNTACGNYSMRFTKEQHAARPAFI